jgi:hypothetical protein
VERAGGLPEWVMPVEVVRRVIGVRIGESLMFQRVVRLEIRIILHLNLLIAGRGNALVFIALSGFIRGDQVLGQQGWEGLLSLKGRIERPLI